MFLLKKYLTPLFYSLSVTMILLFVGVCLLLFTRRQKTGKIMTAAGTFLILILSLGPLPDMMLAHLENTYPPFLLEAPRAEAASSKWVVVLGAGVKTDAALPLVDQMAPASLVRLIEGIRIHKKIPGSKLILSGGVIYNNDPETKLMEKIARTMDVNPKDIVLESKSRDTEEQAQQIVSIVNKDPFILVTSAFHMPRSMTLFTRYGARPIAAPVNRITNIKPGFHPSMLYPSSGGFQKADIAIHEYLGIGWIWLKNRLS
jgi:uncharacterized SAM-binding protein YcdF (DUF218 family)